MLIEAYLRVLSDEDTIRAIEKETNLSNASVKQLKARRGVIGEEMWWNWQTARVPIDIDNTDDGLKKLLLAHKQIFPIIRKHDEGPETDVYLEIVMQYEEGEEPWGLYLSAETVSLLSEIDGALDVDAVPIVHNSHNG
jgi:hypothetical protein